MKYPEETVLGRDDDVHRLAAVHVCNVSRVSLKMDVNVVTLHAV